MGAWHMKRFIAIPTLLQLHSHVKKHVEATSERYPLTGVDLAMQRSAVELRQHIDPPIVRAVALQQYHERPQPHG
jgi:hypothetical protein